LLDKSLREKTMVNFKALAGLAVVSLVTVAAPAHAVITAFATFSPLAADVQANPAYSNMRWVNNGNGSNGTGGSVFSVGSSSVTAPAASRNVNFSFLVPGLSPVATNITAVMTWNGSTNPVELATLTGPTLLTQGGINGTFSFISTSAITVNTTVYAAGSNLLSGTFGDATIIGNQGGSTADFDADTTIGQTLTFTSDFIDFSGTTNSAFALDLANIRSTLSALLVGQPPTTALRTFRTAAGGEFGAEGDLIVNGIPEPQTWGLMVVGFGMIGMQVRRRNRRTTVSA
jgi:hypothetical protein